MNAGEREGLREVLAAHRQEHDPSDGASTCACGAWRGPFTRFVTDERGYGAHLETAVLDWLRARLASDEVREAVARAMYRDVDDFGIDMREAALAHADAALTAALAALGQEGACEHKWFVEPRQVCERDGTEVCARCGERRPVDDEGRSGARDGLTCLAAVPPGWPHVPCVRPFKHEGEHSATPKWVDLFGIDPDFTGGQDVNEWLDESRGDA